MIYHNAIDAIRSAEFFAAKSNLAYALYSAGNGFIVRCLVHANGRELEIIKP